MKREAVGSTKMKKLCRVLRVPLYSAVGIMESIWHLTAREAPRGDIGKLSNEDIALGIDYDGDAEILIAALIECRWLDASDAHRLVVHDWHEHADEAVKKRLTRHGIDFVSKRTVATSRDKSRLVCLPAPEPAPAPEPEPEPAPASGPAEFAQTAQAVRTHFPQTDDEFVIALIHKTAREALSVNGQAKAELSDSLIAEAVRVCYTTKQVSAGLFMKTVPRTVKTWMVQGKSPPQAADELKSTYGKLQPVKPRPGDIGWGPDERESTTGKH